MSEMAKEVKDVVDCFQLQEDMSTLIVPFLVAEGDLFNLFLCN